MKVVVIFTLLAFACGISIAHSEEQSDDGDEGFAELEGQPENSEKGLAKVEEQAQHNSDEAKVQRRKPNWPLKKGCCLKRLYILAFTSNLAHSHSSRNHAVELRARGRTRRRVLYNRPGKDMMQNKGDIWRLNLRDFRFNVGCLRLTDIQNVALVSTNNDGWNIESIVTLVQDEHGKNLVLTQDLDVNRWVDGDGRPISHRRFDLHFP